MAVTVADRSADAYTAYRESYSESLESSVPARWSEKGTYARPKIRAENNAHSVILKSRSSRVAVHSPTILFCPVRARWSRTGVFSRCARAFIASPFPLSPLSRRFHFFRALGYAKKKEVVAHRPLITRCKRANSYVRRVQFCREETRKDIVLLGMI